MVTIIDTNSSSFYFLSTESKDWALTRLVIVSCVECARSLFARCLPPTEVWLCSSFPHFTDRRTAAASLAARRTRRPHQRHLGFKLAIKFWIQYHIYIPSNKYKGSRFFVNGIFLRELVRKFYNYNCVIGNWFKLTSIIEIKCLTSKVSWKIRIHHCDHATWFSGFLWIFTRKPEYVLNV